MPNCWLDNMCPPLILTALSLKICIYFL
uniref:Uncharacterized protein n=1 Tax=Anguilla anguilla TaxID=7936 RepID=A0A0E9PA05_ANGAN